MWYRKAQDMSMPYYRYPEQTRNNFKNHMPLQEDFQGKSQAEIDRKFSEDAKIYVEQMVKDPLVQNNTQAKIMFDTIINDPTYKIERSSFVSLINAYRRIYVLIFDNYKNTKKLAEIKPDAERVLLRILSKM
jgi:hypothetical protein